MSFMNPFIAVCNRSSGRPVEAGSTLMRSLFPDPWGRDYQLVFIGKFRYPSNKIFNGRRKNIDPTEMKHIIGSTENTAIHP